MEVELFINDVINYNEISTDRTVKKKVLFKNNREEA